MQLMNPIESGNLPVFPSVGPVRSHKCRVCQIPSNHEYFPLDSHKTKNPLPGIRIFLTFHGPFLELSWTAFEPYLDLIWTILGPFRLNCTFLFSGAP